MSDPSPDPPTLAVACVHGPSALASHLPLAEHGEGRATTMITGRTLGDAIGAAITARGIADSRRGAPRAGARFLTGTDS